MTLKEHITEATRFQRGHTTFYLTLAYDDIEELCFKARRECYAFWRLPSIGGVARGTGMTSAAEGEEESLWDHLTNRALHLIRNGREPETMEVCVELYR